MTRPLPSQSTNVPKASERTTRDWREVGNALTQKIYDQINAIEEGYGNIPDPALDALGKAVDALDEFDRHLAKIDGRKGGVGGEYVCVLEVRH